MAEKDPNDPSVPSAAYNYMAPKWARIDTLLGGTDAMREAADEYLPPHDQESSANYQDRLHSTTLFNMVELTLDSLVGRPFSSEVQLSDDMPENMQALMDDVDLQGNNVTVFGRAWFRESMAKAFSHVLIDMPAMRTTDDEGRPIRRTRADDARERRRPYWVLISPENVLAMYSEVVNGQEQLTHVRIKEDVVEREGFAEVLRERIRVLEQGSYAVYEKQYISKKSSKFKWVKVEEGQTGLPIIPMVTFYTNRQGLMMGKPPLDDLAHLNVRHWQSTADQINVLTVARFPMLAVAGATDTSGATMAIGPRQLLGTKDANGRFYYVEHTGRAINAGRQDLIDLEEQMASYGAEFLKRQPGNATATGRALDSSEATSALQDHAIRFTDALNQAIAITGMWLNMQEPGSAKINTEFGQGQIEDAEVKALLEARKNGDIPRETFLAELKRHGVLSDDFDPRRAMMLSLMEAAGMDPALADQLQGDMSEIRRLAAQAEQNNQGDGNEGEPGAPGNAGNG
jgi:hypothetical protein